MIRNFRDRALTRHRSRSFLESRRLWDHDRFYGPKKMEGSKQSRNHPAIERVFEFALTRRSSVRITTTIVPMLNSLVLFLSDEIANGDHRDLLIRELMPRGSFEVGGHERGFLALFHSDIVRVYLPLLHPAMVRVYFSFDKLLPTRTVVSAHRLNDRVNDTAARASRVAPRDGTLAYNYYSSDTNFVASPNDRDRGKFVLIRLPLVSSGNRATDKKKKRKKRRSRSGNANLQIE